jgi:hypothetical protein
MHASVTLLVTPDDVHRLDNLAKDLGYTVVNHGSGISLRFPSGFSKKDGSITSSNCYSVPEAIAYLEAVREFLSFGGCGTADKTETNI